MRELLYKMQNSAEMLRETKNKLTTFIGEPIHVVLCIEIHFVLRYVSECKTKWKNSTPTTNCHSFEGTVISQEYFVSRNEVGSITVLKDCVYLIKRSEQHLRHLSLVK